VRTRALACALFIGLGSAAFAAPQAAHAQQGSDEASQRFRAGVAFYKSKDYPAALVEFKRAYELAPNYRVLYNLGQTSQQLNFYADALTAFQQYLAEGGKEIDASRKVSVESAIVELKTKVGTITIETNAEAAEISIDDVPVGTAPLAKPVIVNAGRRKFSASAKGYLPVTRAVDIAGSDSSTVKLELTKIQSEAPPRDPDDPKPPPPPERAIPVAAWVMLGVTGAVGVATGVMGGLALSARGELDDALATLPGNKTTIEDAQTKTQSFAITTDVLIGVTVAAAVTTVVLFVVDFGPDDAEARPSASGVSEASLHVTPGGLSFGGRF
jgi:hypothetical protein